MPVDASPHATPETSAPAGSGSTRRAALIINPIKATGSDVQDAVTRISAEDGWEAPLIIETTADDPGHGQAREALEFYRSVFGGQVVIATYADFGMPAEVPGAGDVVWGQVVAENGFTVMAYDVPAQHRADRPAALRSRLNPFPITANNISQR